MGIANGENCLIELSPFPSKNTSIWKYGSDIGYANRAEMEKSLLPDRIDFIRKLILENTPAFVICYGVGKMKYWSMLLNNQVPQKDSCENRTLYSSSIGNSKVVIVQHPCSRGKWDYFHGVGKKLRNRQ